MKYDYHLIVIGAGSAGLTVASGAAGLGAKTALIENHKMGGDCLNYGCVPSKTFLRTAHLAKDITNGQFALDSELGKVDLKKIMQRVKNVIAEIAPHDSKERFESLGVKVFLGEAEVLDQLTIKIEGRQITARRLVFATGSTALIPPISGLEKVDYLTNKTIFDMEKLPEHLVIIGGGPIGLELGQGFRHLGSRVTIIDQNDHLFPKDDPEVWEIMKKVFAEDQIELCLHCKVNSVLQENDLRMVEVETANGKKTISGDALLVSAGRIPNTAGLNLDKLGVDTDKRGYIITNHKMQTSVKNIFAAGDVTGSFQFTHMAGYQAGKVVPNAILGFGGKASYTQVPWTTYTKPEVAHVGYTQPWAEQLNIYRDSLYFDLSEIDRAKADNDRHGFLKLILGNGNRLIGATMVGEKAGEMIPIASLAIAKGMKASVFASLIFSYPTQAEIFQRLGFEYMKRSFKPWMKKIIQKFFL